MNTRMESISVIALVSALVLLAVSVAPAMANLSPTPPTPYIIKYGYVSYQNETPCNGPVVNVTNVNTSEEWQAETNTSCNYYELVLDSYDVSEGNILRFDAKDAAETQFDTTEHIVNKTEIDEGGLFNFNLTLHPPPIEVSCKLLGVGRHPGHLHSGDALTLTARVKNTDENLAYCRVEWQIKDETGTVVGLPITSDVFTEEAGNGPTRIMELWTVDSDAGKYYVAGILHYGPSTDNLKYSDGPVEDGKFTVV